MGAAGRYRGRIAETYGVVRGPLFANSLDPIQRSMAANRVPVNGSSVGIDTGPDTTPDAVALLLAALESGVVEEMLAVLLIVVPVATPGLIFTEKAKLAEAPEASEPIVHVEVPVAPTAGFVQPKVGPAVCVIDTNVVPIGMLSVSETLAAVEGPAFDTTTV